MTNREFARFARKTGYVTLAEQTPQAEDYPGADPAMLVAGSSVFISPGRPVELRDAYNWWSWVTGADWRHPQGPDSSIRNKPDHPVVHVAWADAEAYAQWVGKQVPTEAEWEFAARGGLEGAEYAWGDDITPGGQRMANTWQGGVPLRQSARRRRPPRTAPVGSFPPNGYGLFDMIGNVWEWTTDWYEEHRRSKPQLLHGAESTGRAIVNEASAQRINRERHAGS